MLRPKTSFLDTPLWSALKLDVEKGLYLLFTLAAIFTRFYRLGDRVMSHDESLHTYFSWCLYVGRGFQHTPMMHGPFLFHINALIYALFGADDFTARISPALFGVALILLPWTLRRWLGRSGALAASFMFLISPFIMYHARYIRNESYVTVWVMLIVWGIFAYLGERRVRWLYLFVTANILLFATKEVSFIYVAIFGLFLALLAVIDLVRLYGLNGAKVLGAIACAMVILVFGVLAAFGVLVMRDLGPSAVAAGGETVPPPQRTGQDIALDVAILCGVAALFGAAAFFALRVISPTLPDDIPSLDLTILLGVFYLPTLAPFASVLFKFDPTDYTVMGAIRSIGMVAVFLAVSIAIGAWWNWRRFLIASGIWYGIFVTLFTTVFTNGAGLGTGLIGSLGYWLAQQDVQRGSQPPYYYMLLVPLYEYLPLIVSTVAIVFYAVRGLRRIGEAKSCQSIEEKSPLAESRLFALCLIYWTILTWIAYSYAGEKMPWLTVHFALPMILLSGYFVGRWIERLNWREVTRGWPVALLVPMFLFAFGGMVGAAGAGAFRGKELAQLGATGQWLASFIVSIGALLALTIVVPRIGWRTGVRVVLLEALALLAVCTLRTAWQWNFINYDYASEFGVYAHGAPGVKIAMRQVEEISRRTAGDHALKILYDSDSSWPLSWYLRDYTNAEYVPAEPRRDQLNAPVILAGSASWGTFEPLLGDRYDKFTYHLIWWPMEDYKTFVGCPAQESGPDGQFVYIAAYDEDGNGQIDPIEKQRGDARCRSYTLRHAVQVLKEWLSKADHRLALWDIFWNRDFSRYDQITGGTHTPDKWPMAHDFRLYVRKDISSLVWDQHVGAVTGVMPPQPPDPYAQYRLEISAVQVIGEPGAGPGQFNAPHGLAIGPDGSLYVADSNNHRIQKFDSSGQFVLAFGSPSDPGTTEPATGTFNEPWGVAVGPDGSVYVADTWNHRIQKFDSNGNLITAWGTAGQTDLNGLGGIFWGPRDVVVSQDGRVYVTDTGNKRIQVFSADGAFIAKFGGGGLLPGQLDEPVGLAIDPSGNIIVNDTWNQRIQVFTPEGLAIRQWEIKGWLDQSVTTKPYVAVDKDGNVYTVDPTGFRVLVFGADGTFKLTFGDFGTDDKSFQLPVGIAVDANGNIYVSDAALSRILKFAPLNLTQGQ